MLTVAIPARNGGQLLRKVIERGLEQQTTERFEILVADTDSTDGTREFLENLAAEDVRVRWFPVKRDEFGHGRTRNRLVERSKGDVVAFLTQDALPCDRHWLDRLVRPLRENPESIAGATGKHLGYPEHGPVQARNLEAHFRQFGEATTFYRIEDQSRYERDEAYRQFLHFYSDNNSALQRRIWEKIPYPDVPFGEDQLWAEAILKAGYAKAWVPDAVVYHSHRYGLRGTISRAKEEALYYHEVFGYRLGNALRPSLQSAWKQMRADWKWMRENGGIPGGERRAVASDLFGLYLGHWRAWKETGRKAK